MNRYKAVVYKHYEVYNRDNRSREGQVLYDTMKTMYDVMMSELKDLYVVIDQVMSELED